MAMLMAARAAFSMEANGCETKRVSTERAAGLSLGPTGFEIVDVRLNPATRSERRVPGIKKTVFWMHCLYRSKVSSWCFYGLFDLYHPQA